MNSAAADTASYLDAQGIGTFAATSGWAIYVSKEPTAPNDTITLYDTVGFNPDPDNGVYNPSMQIRIRGNSYPVIYAKAEAILAELIVPAGVVIGTTNYLGWWQQGSIELIGYDDNDRAIMVLNFNITRQEV
jgi:hypothetical protein